MTQETTTATNSPMLAGIDQAIELLQAQASALSIQIPEVMVGPRRGQPSDDATRQLEELDMFITRLQQVKELLQQDPRLLAPIDEHIGHHVRAMEKRQSAQTIHLAVITTVAGVILGWLISALASPVVLWHLLFH